MLSKLTFILIFSTLLFSKELITPIPLEKDYDEDKAKLGKAIFFDKRLSKDNSISCASCHLLDKGGDDDISVSYGIDGKRGERNSPTVFNTRYNILQFWDGRAKNLKAQIKDPIHNPVEMGTNFEEIIKKLTKDDIYKQKFKAIYKEGITENTITDVLVEFEKALITPNSRFDKFLKGDENILTKEEIEGYYAFKDYGCVSCHNGVNIGGNLMQKIGVIHEYKTEDLGRYNVTKKEKDKYYFKVPSLRNIEHTAPYFHDGETASLEEAVQKMILHQVGYIVSDKDIDNVIAFLKTLNGEIPEILLEKN